MRIPAGLAFVLVIIAMVTGLAIGIYGHTPEPQHLQCEYPTEDSCTPEHTGNGRWVLKPTTP